MHWQSKQFPTGAAAAAMIAAHSETWDALPGHMRGQIVLLPLGEGVELFIGNPVFAPDNTDAVMEGWMLGAAPQVE